MLYDLTFKLHGGEFTVPVEADDEATAEKLARSQNPELGDLLLTGTVGDPVASNQPVTDVALQAIEAEHGFTFGTSADHDTGQQPVIASVVCVTPTCDRLNVPVEVHADTVLPLHCGGCFAVLMCEHVWVKQSVTEGVFAAPVRVDWEQCALCGAFRNKTKTELPAIDLGSLPAGLLATLTSS
jgi:hypothetical protein